MHFLCKKPVMKLMILSSEVSKKEWLSLPFTGEARVTWLTGADLPGNDFQADQLHQPGESPVNKSDAILDLLFDGSPASIDRVLNHRASLIVFSSIIPIPELSAQYFVRINGWPSFGSRRIVEAACENTQLRDHSNMVFRSLNRSVEWTPDQPGFISARILASIINEAHFALEEDVCLEDAVDTALKLGTNYPMGPVEWGNLIGYSSIVKLLDFLKTEDQSFAPCGLIRQKALAQ